MSVSIITFANLGAKRNHRTAGILPVIEKFRKTGDLQQVLCQINAGYDFPHTYSATPTLVRYALRAVEELTGKPLRPMHLKLLDFFAQYKLQKADVYIFHAGESMSRTLRKARRLGGITVSIATISDVQKNVDIETEEMRLLGIADYVTESEKALMRTPDYHSFDYVIAFSDFVRDSYIKKGFPADRIFTAYSDIPLPQKETRRRPEKFKALYVAYTCPRKGLHYLLDAWEQLDLPDAELVLVGKYNAMPRELKEQYNRRIKNNSSITWAGRAKDVTPYYREASAFVFPSLIEGNPKSVMEAMAHSLPIITTTHAQSIVKDGESGFVVPVRDPHAMKEKITFLYHNRDAAEEMGQRARGAMENKKPFGEAVSDIYQTILEREHAAR